MAGTINHRPRSARPLWLVRRVVPLRPAARLPAGDRQVPRELHLHGVIPAKDAAGWARSAAAPSCELLAIPGVAVLPARPDQFPGYRPRSARAARMAAVECPALAGVRTSGEPSA